MKVYFDTSVLVAAVVEQLPNHEIALDSFIRNSEGTNQGFCSTHALAECFATLTALPLPRKIDPREARQIIQKTFQARLTISEITKEEYLQAIDSVSDRGLVSGVIYDALHLESAKSSGCESLLTYNLKDYRRLDCSSISISAP